MEYNGLNNMQSDFETDYEKLSYGKYAYKRIQKLRKKALRRKIFVPKLDHTLTKPDKPRIPFIIMGFISAVLFIGLIVCMCFLANEFVKMIFDSADLWDIMKNLFRPEVLAISFGVSVLPAIIIILIYVLALTFILLPIILAIGFYHSVRETFYMAVCSKEEFAKGDVISYRIFNTSAALIASTAIFVTLMVFSSSAAAKIYSSIIYAIIVLTLGSILTLMIVERKKACKWFNSSDENNQRNYIAHVNALKEIKRRLDYERRFWSNLFSRK